MSTSDFLKVQCDLLIAARLLEKLDLIGYMNKLAEVEADGNRLMDAQGNLVTVYRPEQLKALAVAGINFQRTRVAVL